MAKLNWEKLKTEAKLSKLNRTLRRVRIWADGEERRERLNAKNKPIIDKLHNGKCTVCGKQIDKKYLQCFNCYSTKAVKVRVGSRWIVAVPKAT